MKYLLSMLLAVSSFASAGPIVTVEYEGTVSSVENCSCHPLGLQVGDSVGGQFSIDTDKAPPDTNTRFSFIGYYWPGTEFITSDNFLIGSPRLLRGDAMTVFDRHNAMRSESYSVSDGNIATWPAISVGIAMSNANPRLDLIHGDGPAQSFTATNGNGVRMHGVLRNWLSPRIGYTVRFVVDRMTVKTECRP